MPHVLHLHAPKISQAMFVLLRLLCQGMAPGKTAPDHEMASTSAPPFQQKKDGDCSFLPATPLISSAPPSAHRRWLTGGGMDFLKTHFFSCGMDLLMNYGHKMSSELWSRLLLTFTVQVQNRWFLRLCRLAGSPVGSTAEAMNRIQLTAPLHFYNHERSFSHPKKTLLKPTND